MSIVDLSSQLITGAGAEQALYQVPNAGMTVLQDVINATWEQANTKANLLSAKVAATGAAIDALIATPGTLHVAAGSVTGATATEPTVSIPATAAVADIYADYETQRRILIEYLHVMIARCDWHGVADVAMDLRELEAENK